MSLAHDAAEDWRDIMNSDLGASWECDIISPAGVSAPFLCRMSDISQGYSPGTDEIVSDRQLVISVTTGDLDDAGFSDIRGIESNDLKPWKLNTDNINGKSGTYKIAQSKPDNSMGNMVLWLEVIK